MRENPVAQDVCYYPHSRHPPGFKLEHWEDGPLLQLACLALIVAALSRCGGPRG
jgi:hypothetical protein